MTKEKKKKKPTKDDREEEEDDEYDLDFDKAKQEIYDQNQESL
jgi:hypothetical protein